MLNIYMQIDGLRGESTDSEHKDWIEVLSFNHAITQPASATAAGSGPAARCQHSDYSITKCVDSASPKLYEMCSTGRHIKSVTLEMMRASGERRMKYMVVNLEEVVISRVAPASNGDFPTESVSFNYGKIKWTYIPLRADGSQGGNITGGWNLIQNKIAA